MSVAEVMRKANWYSQQLIAIRDDVGLTDGGRERQRLNLLESYELYGKNTAYKEFEAAWSGLKSELESVTRARRAASQRAEDSWNFERLRYYKEQAQSDIIRTMSLREAEKLIRGIVDTGSREQARAYLDSTGVILSKYHGFDGLGSFLAWMESKAAELTRPPEFDKLDERERELILNAVELRDVTVSAANTIPNSRIGILLKSVQLGMKVDSVSGKYYWDLSFEEPISFATTEPVAS